MKLETMTLATLNTLKEGCLPFPCVHVLGTYARAVGFGGLRSPRRGGCVRTCRTSELTPTAPEYRIRFPLLYMESSREFFNVITTLSRPGAGKVEEDGPSQVVSCRERRLKAYDRFRCEMQKR